MGVLDVVERSWPVLRHGVGLHTHAYRASRGLIGHHVPILGIDMLLLDHVGAKSGKRRTTPLLYVRDGDNLAIIASKGGNPRHPAWFHNLRANPETTVQVGSDRWNVRARQATPDEKGRLWPVVVGVYAPYEEYQQKTTRDIPVIVLERT